MTEPFVLKSDSPCRVGETAVLIWGLNYLSFNEGKKEFVTWVSNGAVC